jgi:hypothetical protein
MGKAKHGSIVLIIVGLLWFMGTIGTIMYAIGSQAYALVLLREEQIRAWLAVESGLLIGLATIQDAPLIYYEREDGTLPLHLYSGRWPIDPRHSEWYLTIQVLEGHNHDFLRLKGTLSNKKNTIVIAAWYLEYRDNQWFFLRGERIHKE